MLFLFEFSCTIHLAQKEFGKYLVGFQHAIELGVDGKNQFGLKYELTGRPNNTLSMIVTVYQFWTALTHDVS